MQVSKGITSNVYGDDYSDEKLLRRRRMMRILSSSRRTRACPDGKISSSVWISIETIGGMNISSENFCFVVLRHWIGNFDHFWWLVTLTIPVCWFTECLEPIVTILNHPRNFCDKLWMWKCWIWIQPLSPTLFLFRCLSHGGFFKWHIPISWIPTVGKVLG